MDTVVELWRVDTEFELTSDAGKAAVAEALAELVSGVSTGVVVDIPGK